MINLIIDGNYVLHRLTFALHKANSINELKTSLSNSIKYWYNQAHWNNVYFISDGKSLWRRSLLPEYKATRKKDSDIDWNEVYDIYADFKKDIKKLVHRNVITFENQNIEGDDWIAHIIDEKNLKGESCFVITSDGDIEQKVFCDYDNLTINILYKDGFVSQKLSLPHDYKTFLSLYAKEMYGDLFGSNDKEYTYEFIQKVIKKYPLASIYKEESLFTKLVSGDKGDNIPSVYIKTGKTGKSMGIGETGAKTIYLHYKEIYNEDIDFNSEIFIERLIDVISLDKKISDNTVKELIKVNIKLNLSLIKLDKQYLPEDIYQIITESYNG